MEKNYSIIALLPMKGNSERVKGKNFKIFCGKPLYRWVLDTLIACQEIDLIVINTDVRDILKNASLPDSKKILIRDRPREIQGDFVSMNKIIENDLDNINANTYLMTHTTNPFLSLQTIKNALITYKKEIPNNKDSLFSVNSFQTRFYKRDGNPINHKLSELKRTQDLEIWYEENSNLYLFSKNSFDKTKNRIGKYPILFETPKYESLDIDTLEDWNYAELIMKAIHQKF